MLTDAPRIVTRRFSHPDSHTLARYLATGGYKALRKALRMKPGAVRDEVNRASLLGRGGAGFPAGRKWSMLRPAETTYLVVNGDESEPATFKDHLLIERDPHQIIEGAAIAAYAVGVRHAFIFCRGEFALGLERLTQACNEAYGYGALGQRIFRSPFSLDIVVHPGAGSYICGEETALIDSLEGLRGQPRLKPPFPAVRGLYGQPTVVNNVETLSNLPHIVLRGGAWFASVGTEKSTGTRLFCCSGHINRPGTYEMLLGTPIRELLEEECRGVWKGRSLKAFQPGGGSMQVLLPEHLDLPLDMDAVAKAGSALGAGAMVFMDETTCMVDISMRLVDFYQHESCGKCAPCREGTYFESDLMHRLEAGVLTTAELATLADICDNMNGKCFCPLGDTATWFVMSAYQAFHDEFEEHCGAGGCPVKRRNRELVPAAGGDRG